MNRRLWLFLAAMFSLSFGTALAQSSTPLPPTVKIAQKADASMFTGANGMTLYTFDPDPVGKSVCNGPCAVHWPPLGASADAKPVGTFTIVTRDDGALQWAYDGKPLYFWFKDKAPGDTTGDGVGGKWHVARPAAP